MNEEKYTGVDQGSDAGSQEEFKLEDILFSESDDTGVNDEGDAGPGAEGEQGEGSTEDQGAENKGHEDSDPVSKAFAAKWSAKESEIREDERKKVMEELEQRTQTTPQQQQQGAAQHRDMSDQELEKMADDYGVSVEVMRILHKQQQMINQQHEESRRQAQAGREQAEFNEAINYAQKAKSENSAMPDFDKDALHKIRLEHWRKHQTVLPWREAYLVQVADKVLSGELARHAQQETLNKIQERETASGSLKSTSSKKPGIRDLSKDRFEEMVEEVKSGKHSRT